MTSISLAIVSFSICYALIDQGVDAAALLAKVNIDATSATEKGTTVAIAYAIHKAASPIRRSPRARARRPYGASMRRPRAGFPPTVALTPVVAKFLKQGNDGADDDRQGGSWAKYTDDATGATYWHNEKTGVSTWEKPE